MDRAEFEAIVAPVREIYEGGQLRGFAFFEDSDHSVALGTRDMSEAEVGFAIYRILRGRSFSVEKICTALINCWRSEQRWS